MSIKVRGRSPVQMGKLAWMMRRVTGDNRRPPARLDQHADVMRSVARGRQKSHTINDHMIIGHEIDKPGLVYRQHRIGEAGVLVGDLVLRFGLPIAKLSSRHDIASGGECGLPGPIHQLCVPPNVIKMQMRIDDVIDVTRRHAGRLESGEKVRLYVVPSRDCDTFLAIADTSIDHDRVAVDEYQERLNQSPRTPCLINEMGPQPRVAGDGRKIKFGNQTLKCGRGIQLRDTDHRGIADAPARKLSR